MQTWLLYYGVWLWVFGLGVSVLLAVALRSWWPSFVIRRRARHITRQIPPLRKEILIEEEQTFLGTLHAKEPVMSFEDGSPCAAATLCSTEANAQFTASKRLHLKVEGIEHNIYLQNPSVIIGSGEAAHDRLTARMPIKTLALMKEANLVLNDFGFQISMRSLKEGDKVYARGKVKISAAEGDGYRTPSTQYTLLASEEDKPLALFFQGTPVVVRRWGNLFAVGFLQAIFLFSLVSYLLGAHFLKDAEKQIKRAGTSCVPATALAPAAYAAITPFTRAKAFDTYATSAMRQCYRSAEQVYALNEILRDMSRCSEQISLLRQKRLYQEAIKIAQSCEAPNARREAALSYFALGYFKEASQLIAQEPNTKPDPEKITEDVLLHFVAGNKKQAMESAKQGAGLLEQEALRLGTQGKKVSSSYSYPEPSTRPIDEPDSMPLDAPPSYNFYPSSQAHLEIEDADKKQPYLSRRAAAFECIASYLGEDKYPNNLYKGQDRTAREECKLLLIEKTGDNLDELLDLLDTPDGVTELGRFEPLGFDIPGIQDIIILLAKEKLHEGSDVVRKTFNDLLATYKSLPDVTPIPALERALSAKLTREDSWIQSALLYSKALSASRRQNHAEALAAAEMSIDALLSTTKNTIEEKRAILSKTIDSSELSFVELFVRSAVYTDNQTKLQEFIQLLPEQTQNDLISDEILSSNKQQLQLFFVLNEHLQRGSRLLNEITEGDAWRAALDGDKGGLASAMPHADPISIDALLWYAYKKGLGSSALLDWILLAMPAPAQSFGVTRQLIDNHRVLWLTSLFGGAPDKELQGSIAPLEELLLRREHAILLYILENPANFREVP
jgi:hypothetical protein